MFKFSAEQRILDIAGVKVGGQPGEYPTVLIGSIFYSGHRIVSDPEKGVFDRSRARDLLDQEAALSLETGNPRIVDVVGDTAEALGHYVEFVAEHIDGPFFVDSATAKARMGAIKLVAEMGLLDRTIYNSIDEHTTEEELAVLEECGVKYAMILAFSTRHLHPSSRMKLLLGEQGLLAKASRAGIEQVLIDTGVLDVPNIGWAAQIAHDVKEATGHPVGCAPANAFHSWERMRKKGTPSFEAAGSAMCTLPQVMGADFVHYGPMAYARWVYPACSTADAMIAYNARTHQLRPQVQTHPLYRIF